MLLCVPTYKQLLKREKCTRITVRDLDEEHETRLQGCFDSTDRSMLRNDPNVVNENVNVFSAYIDICVHIIVLARELMTYTNNKPWITKDINI